jgi:hypothetical protein
MKIFLLSVSFLGLLVSCDLFTPRVEIKFDREAFNTQRQLWQSSNIKNYSYRLRAVGFFNYDGTIIVENGEYKEDRPSKGSDEFSGYFRRYSSIYEIYSWIELEFTSNNNKRPDRHYHLEEILVLYDETLHIPVEVHDRYYTSPSVIIDGTFDYYISDFKADGEIVDRNSIPLEKK